MQRRTFLGALGALPFIGKAVAASLAKPAQPASETATASIGIDPARYHTDRAVRVWLNGRELQPGEWKAIGTLDGRRLRITGLQR